MSRILRNGAAPRELPNPGDAPFAGITQIRFDGCDLSPRPVSWTKAPRATLRMIMQFYSRASGAGRITSSRPLKTTNSYRRARVRSIVISW